MREYSKTDAQAVINFVEDNELSNLSKREALKWLKGKGKLGIVNEKISNEQKRTKKMEEWI